MNTPTSSKSKAQLTDLKQKRNLLKNEALEVKSKSKNSLFPVRPWLEEGGKKKEREKETIKEPKVNTDGEFDSRLRRGRKLNFSDSDDFDKLISKQPDDYFSASRFSPSSSCSLSRQPTIVEQQDVNDEELDLSPIPKRHKIREEEIEEEENEEDEEEEEEGGEERDGQISARDFEDHGSKNEEKRGEKKF